jgi:hypothetical protein
VAATGAEDLIDVCLREEVRQTGLEDARLHDEKEARPNTHTLK